jgi:hypothetical protein
VFVKKIEGFGQSHLFSMAAPSHCGLPHARCAVPEYSAWPGDAEARSLSRSMQAALASALPCGLKVSAGGWSRDTLPANKRRLIAQLQRLDSSYPGGLRMSAPRPPLAAPSAHPNARRGTNRSPLYIVRALPHPARDSAQKRTSPTPNSFCGKQRTKSTLSTGARSTGTQLEYSQSIRLPITGNRKHHRTHFEYPTNTYRSVPLLCCRTPCVGEPPGCGVHAHACLQLIPRGLAAQLCSGGPARAPPRRYGAPGKSQSACSPSRCRRGGCALYCVRVGAANAVGPVSECAVAPVRFGIAYRRVPLQSGHRCSSSMCVRAHVRVCVCCASDCACACACACVRACAEWPFVRACAGRWVGGCAWVGAGGWACVCSRIPPRMLTPCSSGRWRTRACA